MAENCKKTGAVSSGGSSAKTQAAKLSEIVRLNNRLMAFLELIMG